MTLSFSAAAANAQAVALASSIGSGAQIQIRTGAKPATPDTAAAGTLLATIPVSGAFTATGAVLAAADPASVLPTTEGQAGHFRVLTSGGTPVIDGTVTATGGGGDMTMGSTTVTMGVSLDMGVPQFTMPTA